ncbi:MAG: hypothetical protein R3B06_04580 [Kofleriaceae bacterium]
MLRTVTVIAALLLVAAPAAHAGQCAPRLLTPAVVTPDGAALPADGGLLVVDQEPAQASLAPGVGARPFPGPIGDWRLVAGKQRIAPTVKTVAPGLRVIAPAGTRLVGARKVPIATFSVDKAPRPALAAPVATGVIERTSGGRRSYTTLRAELKAPAAPGRYLVVLGQDGAPRSWGQAAPGGREVIVYASGGCTTVPDGTIASRRGEQVRLVWVDADGRTSPPSAPLTVMSDPSTLGGPASQD